MLGLAYLYAVSDGLNSVQSDDVNKMTSEISVLCDVSSDATSPSSHERITAVTTGALYWLATEPDN